MQPRSTCGVAALLLVLFALGACSSGTAVNGRGSLATPPRASVSGFPATSPSAPSTSPSDVPTSAVPTVTPSSATASAPATPVAKVCPLRSRPPFCYSLPAGFRDYSYLKNYGKGWQYRTIVSVGRHDLIEVLASRFKHGTDRLSNAELTSYFDRELRSKPGRYHVRKAGGVRRLRVDGARSYEQHLVYTDGVQGDTTTVFRGHAIISISCQSKTDSSAVRTACSRVHHSISIG